MLYLSWVIEEDDNVLYSANAALSALPFGESFVDRRITPSHHDPSQQRPCAGIVAGRYGWDDSETGAISFSRCCFRQPRARCVRCNRRTARGGRNCWGTLHGKFLFPK